MTDTLQPAAAEQEQVPTISGVEQQARAADADPRPALAGAAGAQDLRRRGGRRA